MGHTLITLCTLSMDHYIQSDSQKEEFKENMIYISILKVWRYVKKNIALQTFFFLVYYTTKSSVSMNKHEQIIMIIISYVEQNQFLFSSIDI